VSGSSAAGRVGALPLIPKLGAPHTPSPGRPTRRGSPGRVSDRRLPTKARPSRPAARAARSVLEARRGGWPCCRRKAVLGQQSASSGTWHHHRTRTFADPSLIPRRVSTGPVPSPGRGTRIHEAAAAVPGRERVQRCGVRRIRADHRPVTAAVSGPMAEVRNGGGDRQPDARRRRERSVSRLAELIRGAGTLAMEKDEAFALPVEPRRMQID
jgi:hypothetical protein